MDEHRHEQELDVLGNHVRPSVEQRPRACCALEREAPADGAADDDRLLLARGAYELHDPAVEHVVDVDVLGRGTQIVDFVERHGRLQLVQGMSEALLLQDLQLVLHVRVAERRAQEEAVELRLGQRERALVLDRVLGRDEQERRWAARA